jgi:twitching motility protein PilI
MGATSGTPTGTSGGDWLAPSEALTQLHRPAPLTDANSMRTAAVRFGYRVGSLGFLVGASVLSEFLPAPEIYPIPNVHSSIRGYVNLQGALVPVWDLRSLLGDDAENAGEAVLVLGRGEQRVGLAIEGLPKALKRLERVARPPRLPDALENYAKEALFGDDNLWFEFDHEGFFRMQTERLAA